MNSNEDAPKFYIGPVSAADGQGACIQGFDFDPSNGAISAFYFPAEVVPDGEGGLLATWTGNDSQLGITNSSEALVRHFDNVGGTLDYVMPFASQRWFRQGNDNPHGLTVNENNVAFGSDGQSIVAFDVNTGLRNGASSRQQRSKSLQIRRP
jgi:hypothetical protein